LFDIIPEIIAAEQLGHVAPDFVTFSCQAQGEPLCKLIVGWIRMAEKDGLSVIENWH
jgi:hypothetical protein